ncbi:MAG: DUF4251 domain-containing protein [Bacteroidota bacterium]
MKTRILISVLCFVVLSCAGSKSEAELAEKQKSYEQLKSLVASGTYQFNAEVLYPQETQDVANTANALLGNFGNEGSYVGLKPGYFLKIQNDSAMAKLPYIGEIRRVNSYGKSDNAGIIFNSPIKDYAAESTKRMGMRVKLETKDLLESYDVVIKLYSNYTADVTINSSNRSIIRYKGVIVPIAN